MLHNVRLERPIRGALPTPASEGTETRVTTFGYDGRGYVSSVENKVSETVNEYDLSRTVI